MGRSSVVGLAILGLLASEGFAATPKRPAAASKPVVITLVPHTSKTSAKTLAKSTTKTTKKPAKKQPVASKRSARMAAAKHGVGKRLASTKVAAKLGGGAVGRGPHPRIATSDKPLVAVARLQADGRVKYGPDRMPPGFAWPPTPSMVAASRACEAQLDALGIAWKASDPEGMVADPIVVPAMEIGGVRYTSAFRRKTPPAMARARHRDGHQGVRR